MTSILPKEQFQQALAEEMALFINSENEKGNPEYPEKTTPEELIKDMDEFPNEFNVIWIAVEKYKGR